MSRVQALLEPTILGRPHLSRYESFSLLHKPESLSSGRGKPQGPSGMF